MPPLRFAMDAQELLGRTGMATYARRIVGALSELDRTNSWVLPYIWSPRRRLPLLPELPGNFRYHAMRVPMPVARRLDRVGFLPSWDRFSGGLDACLFPGRVRLLRKGANVRVIYDLNHALHPDTMRSPRVAREYADDLTRSAPRLAAAIAITETVRQEAIEILGIPADRVVVAGCAVDHDVFHPRPSLETVAVRRRLGVGDDYVLFVGMIEPRKNIPALIRAFCALPAARAGDIELVIAGPAAWGWDAVSDELTRAHTQGARVHALGFVAEPDLAALYAGARLFVLPSVYEGFGIPILEAMASGAPVLASTAAALVEVAGGSAAHAAPDEGALAAAMDTLLADDEALAAMRTRGLARASQFNWRDSARTVLDTMTWATTR